MDATSIPPERAARLRRLARRVAQAREVLSRAEGLARQLGRESGWMPLLFFAQQLRAARQVMEAPADAAALFEGARHVAGPEDDTRCEGG